jgi:CRISPR associated protein Cas2
MTQVGQNAMNTIQVNYDLRGRRDYDRLYEYFDRYGTRACRLLYSCWLIRTNKSAKQVRDEVKRHVDADDEVATFDVTRAAWATNFSDSSTAWLKGNMGYRRARRAA